MAARSIPPMLCPTAASASDPVTALTYAAAAGRSSRAYVSKSKSPHAGACCAAPVSASVQSRRRAQGREKPTPRDSTIHASRPRAARCRASEYRGDASSVYALLAHPGTKRTGSEARERECGARSAEDESASSVGRSGLGRESSHAASNETTPPVVFRRVITGRTSASSPSSSPSFCFVTVSGCAAEVGRYLSSATLHPASGMGRKCISSAPSPSASLIASSSSTISRGGGSSAAARAAALRSRRSATQVWTPATRPATGSANASVSGSVSTSSEETHVSHAAAAEEEEEAAPGRRRARGGDFGGGARPRAHPRRVRRPRSEPRTSS